MRPGAALPVALFTLGLVGALAIAGAWTARRVAEDARGEVAALTLDRQAQEALSDAVARWDSVASHRPVGAQSAVTQVGPAWILTVTSTRIGASSHWVVVEAVGTVKPFSHNRIGLLLSADSTGAVRDPLIALVRLP